MLSFRLLATVWVLGYIVCMSHSLCTISVPKPVTPRPEHDGLAGVERRAHCAIPARGEASEGAGWRRQQENVVSVVPGPVVLLRQYVDALLHCSVDGCVEENE